MKPDRIAAIREAIIEHAAYPGAHTLSVRLADLRGLLAAADPAWTPGPPTEPGEWWVTWRPVDPEARPYARLVTLRRDHGGRLWVDPPCDRERTIGTLDWHGHRIVAHMPLSRPEPYRGEP